MPIQESVFRAHIVYLLKLVCSMGISALDAMEKAGAISREDRRALQYDLVDGIDSAQLVMEDSSAALKSHADRHQDKVVRANMDGGIRRAVGEWLEYVLGAEWRLADISMVQFPPTTQGFREHLVALRKALTAKPSEIIEKLPVRDVPKCSRCHQSGHMAFDCPFTAEKEVSDAGGSAGG